MRKSDKVRVLIVDDEPLGRTMVRRMLENHPEAEVIGECENGHEAIAAIGSDAPDLVFLDVQMPEIDGFEVLENINSEEPPVIIFVTAFDEYALRAFDVNALDYLLKPYDRKRFEQAFERAAIHIKTRTNELDSRQILSLLSQAPKRESFIERFIIKSDGRVIFLNTEEIIWIEAEGNYVLLHAAQKAHIFREAIGKLEEQLNPQVFIRISRSGIVNRNFIKELHTEFRGSYNVILKNGTELKLSNRYRENLSKYSGGKL
jgi:two-component system, LytTR family, response regulator